MQDKPMLILSVVLFLLVCLYFILSGFSTDKWTRYGEYAGLVMCLLVIIDNLFRP